MSKFPMVKKMRKIYTKFDKLDSDYNAEQKKKGKKS